MFTRRLFQVLVACAALCALPAAPVFAHGGGGGGGGGHGGGGVGGHAGGSFGGGGAARSSGGYSAGRAYSGSYAAHPANASGSYHHSNGGNWGNNHGNWDHGHGDWDHNHGYWGGGWGWGFGIGFDFPFGFGYWGYPYASGGYYCDYFNPYGQAYSTAYPAADYGYSYPDAGQYTANFPGTPNPSVNNEPQAGPGLGEPAGGEGFQYYNEAHSAFTAGDYRNALRLAGHASVESPQNPRVYELTSLALFASGEYRGAATAAHAALALGAPGDWANLFAYYNDADKYTAQLRKLEKAVADAPTSAAGHFLLGYHYLMTGAKQEAKKHFAEAAKLTPNDKLAQHIVKQLESTGTVTPPVLPEQPGAPAAPGAAKGKQL